MLSVASHDIWLRDMVTHYGPYQNAEGHPKDNKESYDRSFSLESNQKYLKCALKEITGGLVINRAYSKYASVVQEIKQSKYLMVIRIDLAKLRLGSN